MKRRNISWLKNAVRQKYAWPGGYPISAIMEDGALCMDCVRKEWRQVAWETMHGIRGCWRVRFTDVLWEGGNYCDNCNACLDAYPAEEEEV